MSEADRIRLQHMLDAAEEALSIAQDRSRVSMLAVMKDDLLRLIRELRQILPVA